jgi:hypothetical protein
LKNANFSNGLNTRPDPHLIAASEGVVYENIDNFKGSLTPVKQKTDTAISIEAYAYFYEDKSQWVSSANQRSYVEYNKILYYSEPATFPKKFDGTNEFRLGIETPTNAPTLAVSDNAPAAPTGFDSSVAAGSLPKNTNFTYLIVNKSGSNIYSATFTDTVKTQQGADSDITIGPIEGFDTETEVYRRYEGVFRLVGSILTDTGTLVDNTLDISGNAAAPSTFQSAPAGIYQYVYTFYNSSDGSESGTSPISDEIDASGGGEITLSGLDVSADPQVDQKRIYRIGGNLTAFSLVDTIPNAQTSYVDSLGDTEIPGDIVETFAASPAPDDLQFLTESNSIFFGAVGRRLQFTNIDQPNVWPDLNFIDFEADITGIGATPNGLLVMTRYKTWIITGTDSAVFTRFILSRDQGCILHDAIRSIGDTLFWPSTDGICASNGGPVIVISKNKLGKVTLNPVNATVHDEQYYLHEADGTILVFDNRLEGLLKRLNLGTTQVYTAEDVLYGRANGTLHTLFSANDNETLKYKSPRYIESEYSQHKIYKTIYVHAEGPLNIKVYVDDDLAQEIDITGPKDTYEIKIKQEQHRGYSMQIEVEGTGILYEWENKVYGRQNGR